VLLGERPRLAVSESTPECLEQPRRPQVIGHPSEDLFLAVERVVNR
jgi:hypothetical protein